MLPPLHVCQFVRELLLAAADVRQVGAQCVKLCLHFLLVGQHFGVFFVNHLVALAQVEYGATRFVVGKQFGMGRLHKQCGKPGQKQAGKQAPGGN